MHPRRTTATTIIALAVLLIALGTGCGRGGSAGITAADNAAAAAADAARRLQNLIRGGEGELPPAARPPGLDLPSLAPLGSGVPTIAPPGAGEVALAGATTAERTAAYRQAAELVEPHVERLPPVDRQRVVGAACKVVDLVGIVGSATLDEAAASAVVALGGRATLKNRVIGLASDLAEADSTAEAARAAPGLVVAVVCEAV